MFVDSPLSPTHILSFSEHFDLSLFFKQFVVGWKKKKGFCLCVFGVGKHKSQLCLVLSAQLHFCPSPLHHSAISAFIIKAEPIRTNTEQFVATWDGFHWRRWEEYLSCGVDEIKKRIFLEEINNGYSVQSSTIESIVTLSQATAGILISIYF